MKEDALIGKKINSLTVVSFFKSKGSRDKSYNCVCVCGKNIVLYNNELVKGAKKSCGCINYKVKHGMSKTDFYKIWTGMFSRCYNANTPQYSQYGGRGVSVCERWQNFNNFKTDMFNSYKEGLFLKRNDVN
jgi:hypothetical protein